MKRLTRVRASRSMPYATSFMDQLIEIDEAIASAPIESAKDMLIFLNVAECRARELDAALSADLAARLMARSDRAQVAP